jgi:hypothetical protein
MRTNNRNGKLKQKLSQRHQILLDKINRQRDTFTSELGQIKSSFAFAENGYSLFARLKQNPFISVAAVAAIWLLKPSRILAFASKGFAAWQIWRSVAPLIAPIISAVRNRVRPPTN